MGHTWKGHAHDCPFECETLAFIDKTNTKMGQVERYGCPDCLEVFTFIDFDFREDIMEEFEKKRERPAKEAHILIRCNVGEDKECEYGACPVCDTILPCPHCIEDECKHVTYYVSKEAP